MASFESTEETWELYYWTNMKEDGKNHMIGRGEFVRLMFEIAGIEYIDHGIKDMPKVVQFLRGGGNTDFPALAPPAIKKGSFVLSQTPAIMKFLGKQFRLFPDNEIDEAHADSLMASVTDFVAEGRLVFHPKCFTMSYYSQIEEAKPTVAWFESSRLPQFLNYFESALTHNAENKGHSEGYFVGSSLTYVDVAAFHAVIAACSQFPESSAKILESTHRLVAFKALMESNPRIAAYLVSDRRGLFEGNSMM